MSTRYCIAFHRCLLIIGGIFLWGIDRAKVELYADCRRWSLKMEDKKWNEIKEKAHFEMWFVVAHSFDSQFSLKRTIFFIHTRYYTLFPAYFSWDNAPLGFANQIHIWFDIWLWCCLLLLSEIALFFKQQYRKLIFYALYCRIWNTQALKI